ncbi:MAG: hypothetical protein EB015_05520 [Methylocystaceae bacterium]|nr:hypothetical protein [Methylocystaceae bacterium]
MSNIVKFGGANLPSPQSLSSALRSIEADVGSVGTVIIKMDRTGHWVYGADQTEVEKDTLWAVNPYSFVHGYIAWGTGEVLAEKMVSIADPLPELDPPPPGAQAGWQPQVGVSLKCLSGEDKGMEARFATTSVGGKRSMHALAIKVADQADKNPDKLVAVVKLLSDHYPHKTYGKIYTPVFDVVEWIGMDGADEVAEPAPSADTGRRRRS